MADIHPHWHSTQDDSDNENERDALFEESSLGQPIHINIGTTGVSRRIPAIIACLIVFAGGIFLARHLDETNAQLQNPEESSGEETQSTEEEDLTVRISDNGLNPVELIVKPGDTITWINDDTIPHILKSETLLDEDGKPLYTPAIFPDAEEHFTVGNLEPGEYEYISSTSENINGKIIIEGEDSSEPTDGPSIGSASSSSRTGGPSIEGTTSSRSSLGQIPSGQVPDPFETFTPQDIPTNPYTVGGTREHPFDSTGNPLDNVSHGGAPLGNVTSRPYTQPDSGPTLWIVVGSSLMLFVFGTRKYFRMV